MHFIIFFPHSASTVHYSTALNECDYKKKCVHLFASTALQNSMSLSLPTVLSLLDTFFLFYASFSCSLAASFFCFLILPAPFLHLFLQSLSLASSRSLSFLLTPCLLLSFVSFSCSVPASLSLLVPSLPRSYFFSASFSPCPSP